MIGVITGGGGVSSTPSNSLNNYASLPGNTWGATASNRMSYLAGNGTLANFWVRAQADPGIGSYTFNVRKNTIATGVSVTITAGGTLTQSDLLDNFSFSAGDSLDIQCVPTGTPGATQLSWGCTIDCAAGSLLIYFPAANGTASTTSYLPVLGEAVATTAAETSTQQVMPTAGVISNAYGKLNNSTVSGSLVTLYLNGAPTLLAVTFVGAAVTASDTTHSISVVAGDTVSWEFQCGSTAARPFMGCVFTPTVNGESITMVSAIQTQSSNTTRYTFVTGGGAGGGSWTATESDRQNVAPIAMKVYNLYQKTVIPPATAIPLTITVAVTLRLNTASSLLVSTVTGTGTTGNDTTHQISVVAGDLMDFQSAAGVTVSAIANSISMVYFIQPTASSNQSLLLMGVGS